MNEAAGWLTAGQADASAAEQRNRGDGRSEAFGGSAPDASDALDAPWQDFQVSGLRVLLVDDDDACLTIIEQMLLRCKYSGGEVVGGRGKLGEHEP